MLCVLFVSLLFFCAVLGFFVSLRSTYVEVGFDNDVEVGLSWMLKFTLALILLALMLTPVLKMTLNSTLVLKLS